MILVLEEEAEAVPGVVVLIKQEDYFYLIKQIHIAQKLQMEKILLIVHLKQDQEYKR